MNLKALLDKVVSRWYICFIGIFMIAVLVMYMLVGENSYIAIPDNLDLFVAQYKMMQNTGTFFSKGASVPFLNGISRDNLPGEFYLYSIFYEIFSPFTAYILGYLCKIIIAIVSCLLLVRDFGEDGDETAWICAFAYGILNLFPAFGIPFASIPLVIWILKRIYKEGFKKSVWKYYLLLFLYPVVSYFSYFGMFILGYLVLAIIWRWVCDRKPSWSLCLSLVVLGLGYAAFEYRLFGTMLFSDEITIRSTMKDADMSFLQILSEIKNVWLNGMMHADDAHKYFVLPVCAVYFLILNIGYIKRGEIKKIPKDIFNVFAVLNIFNSVVYGLYYSEGMRNLVSALVPPLTGWQFNRTIFFSPFLWYASLYIVCKRMLEYSGDKKTIAGRILAICGKLIPVIAVFVILLGSEHYNDVYDTAYGTAFRLKSGHEVDRLSYGEFYSEKLFEKIKEELDYNPDEWTVAYGLHPAVLEYNGLSTLDGYLGFYSQEYKEAFRKVIAPALDRKENTRIYFDDWGARCYLYSGTDDSIVMATRSYAGVTDTDIYIDSDALKELNCKYIISRIEISNAKEKDLELRGTFADESSPYEIYVYELNN